MMIILTWKKSWVISLCCSVWFGFVFGCVDKFDPVAD
jgi:uncharacterized membrane protein YccC